jgi:leader peptidase (prepilin peptidase)/N-methyltransferase
MTKIFILFLGLAVGIVINYLADVLPLKRLLVRPICLNCGANQKPFNYFVWPRRCDTCGRSRSIRSWVVEFIFCLVALWLWNSPHVHLGFWAGIIILAYLGLVAIIDLEHRLILHPVSVFGAILGLVTGIWLHGTKSTLLGGVAGFAVMLVLYYLGTILMGWLARKRGQILEEEALGFGDVNLSGVLGLILGWPGILIGLVLTILIAGVVSFVYLLVAVITRRYRYDMAVPYGPFLISGAIALLFFRDFILKYLGW